MCECARSGWIPSRIYATKKSVAGGDMRTVWGPVVWRLLHDLAELTAGVDDWEELGRVLPDALPCAECRRHMTAWIEANPLQGDGARAWMLAAHNAVNERLGRRVWAAEELVSVYRGCDRLMLKIEVEGMLRDVEGGVLSAAAVRVIERMLESV